MKAGFSAGCSLEVTLKFADYENMKPSYWAGVTVEYDPMEETIPTREQLLEQIKEAQTQCREICEAQIDKDIYDVKKVKVFEQLNYKKK